MKKLVLIIGVVALGLVSCSKEDTPGIIQGPDNCGFVVSDRASDYSVVIRNNNTGNDERFHLSQGDWMYAYVGEDYCITNVGSWRSSGDTLTMEEAIQIKEYGEKN